MHNQVGLRADKAVVSSLGSAQGSLHMTRPTICDLAGARPGEPKTTRGWAAVCCAYTGVIGTGLLGRPRRVGAALAGTEKPDPGAPVGSRAGQASELGLDDPCQDPGPDAEFTGDPCHQDQLGRMITTITSAAELGEQAVQGEHRFDLQVVGEGFHPPPIELLGRCRNRGYRAIEELPPDLDGAIGADENRPSGRLDCQDPSLVLGDGPDGPAAGRREVEVVPLGHPVHEGVTHRAAPCRHDVLDLADRGTRLQEGQGFGGLRLELRLGLGLPGGADLGCVLGHGVYSLSGRTTNGEVNKAPPPWACRLDWPISRARTRTTRTSGPRGPLGRREGPMTGPKGIMGAPVGADNRTSRGNYGGLALELFRRTGLVIGPTLP